MKNTQVIAAAAFALLAATAAQAETYEGVNPLTKGNSRADVSAQGPAAVKAGNLYGEAAGSGVATAKSVRSRAALESEAVATAKAPGQNLVSGAFVNSQVPSQYGSGVQATAQAER